MIVKPTNLHLKRPFDILLFDIDETIMDFKRTQKEAFNDLMKHFNLDCLGLSIDELEALYNVHNHECWHALEQGQIKFDDLRYRRFEQFLHQLSLETTHRSLQIQIEDVVNFYEESLSSKAYLLEGALETLNWLKNHQIFMGVITNGISKVQRGRLKQSNIIDFFQVVAISHELGVSKPNEAIFKQTLEICQQFFTQPIDLNRVLMIGDSMTTDIRGAKSMGIKACWLNPNQQIDHELKADFVISRLEELKDIV